MLRSGLTRSPMMWILDASLVGIFAALELMRLLELERWTQTRPASVKPERPGTVASLDCRAGVRCNSANRGRLERLLDRRSPAPRRSMSSVSSAPVQTGRLAGVPCVTVASELTVCYDEYRSAPAWT